MMEWIYASIAAVLAAILSSMGLGGGSVLLLYLTAFLNTDQLTAQSVNLLFFVPCAIVALCFHAKGGYLNKRLAISLGIWGLLGVILGFLVAFWLPGKWLAKAFAVFLLGLGIKELFFQQK